METRTSRQHSPSSSLSRSRSPISGSEKRSVSASPRRGPSTPGKPAVLRNNSDDEQDPTDRELLTLDDDGKVILDDTSSAVVSDTDLNRPKKRSHHRHSHRHHHKQPKSGKRSSSSSHRHSVKRKYVPLDQNVSFTETINDMDVLVLVRRKLSRPRIRRKPMATTREVHRRRKRAKATHRRRSKKCLHRTRNQMTRRAQSRVSLVHQSSDTIDS